MTAELIVQIEQQLRTLRAADSQPKAVAWMKATYTVLEKCLVALNANEPQQVVFAPEKPKLEIVKALPPNPLTPIYNNPPVWFKGNTTVYGKPKAWTHKDTLKLEQKKAQK